MFGVLVSLHIFFFKSLFALLYFASRVSACSPTDFCFVYLLLLVFIKVEISYRRVFFPHYSACSFSLARGDVRFFLSFFLCVCCCRCCSWLLNLRRLYAFLPLLDWSVHCGFCVSIFVNKFFFQIHVPEVVMFELRSDSWFECMYVCRAQFCIGSIISGFRIMRHCYNGVENQTL